MKYLYIILISLFLIACSSANEIKADNMCTTNNIDAGADTNSDKGTLYKVYADNSLSEEKQLNLSLAFSKWSIKTEGTVRFDISFVESNFLQSDPNITNTIYVFNKNPNSLGWAAWGTGAVIAFKQDLDIKLFYAVALHEIGHALHLVHYDGPNKSIMDPYLENGFDISCQDIRDFCVLWNCNIKCELEENVELNQ